MDAVQRPMILIYIIMCHCIYEAMSKNRIKNKSDFSMIFHSICYALMFTIIFGQLYKSVVLFALVLLIEILYYNKKKINNLTKNILQVTSVIILFFI